LGDDADVYLSSAEVAAITSKLGYIPTIDEYLTAMNGIKPMAAELYQFLNFDQISEYQEAVGHIVLDTILEE
jgi:aconitate hydratase 2/2-methylisocitrate dehydratase